MSCRVSKAKTSARSTLSRYVLLAAISRSPTEMPLCSNCEAAGASSCSASPGDSSRCERCLRQGLGSCDVLGPTEQQLRSVSRSFQSADASLGAALEELEQEEERVQEQMAQVRTARAKVSRAHKVRKMWADKIHRMVRRGIDSLEELDRVEAEERAESERQAVAQQAATATSEVGSPLDFPADLSFSWADWPQAAPGSADETAEQFAGSS